MNKNGLLKAVDSVFGKTFALSLTKGYVAKWGPIEAIRELIQNALDSDSPFVYEFIEQGTGVGLMLNSEFSTLTPQTLLLGATSKATSSDAIGSFGEGYKIALLVLTREGYTTEILNGDLIWRPCFRFSRMFDEEVLYVDQYVSSDRSNKGLTFIVWGVEDIKEQIIASCLQMQRDVGEVNDRPKQHLAPGVKLVNGRRLLQLNFRYIDIIDMCLVTCGIHVLSRFSSSLLESSRFIHQVGAIVVFCHVLFHSSSLSKLIVQHAYVDTVARLNSTRG